jgi:hypothetical protein
MLYVRRDWHSKMLDDNKQQSALRYTSPYVFVNCNHLSTFIQNQLGLIEQIILHKEF